MTSFAMKLVFLFTLLTAFCARAQQTKKQDHVTTVRNFPIPNYLMALYTKWTNQSTESKNKIPFNATAVRAMYFSSIQKTGTNSAKLTVSLGGLSHRVKVMRDELHLYIVKPTASQQAKTFTLCIKDGLTNKQIASKSVKIQNSGWFTVPLDRKLQHWFNSGQSTCSLNVEFTFTVGNGGQMYPSIGTARLQQPYLIVYMR